MASSVPYTQSDDPINFIGPLSIQSMWLANLYLSLCALTLNFGWQIRGLHGILSGLPRPVYTICRSHQFHRSPCQFTQCDWPICFFRCVLLLWIFGWQSHGLHDIQYSQQHPAQTIYRSHRLHKSQCQFSQCNWPICIFPCGLSLWILADKSVCHMIFYLASRIPCTQSDDPINFIGPFVNSINVTGQFVSFLVCSNCKFWQKNPWVMWYSIWPAASRIHNLPIPSTS